ncbi:MAG TPA: nicotinate-nucleotide adenylyltransferase [Methylomirabilota bacterium]
MARVAVFGGSFNPVHYGHLLLADEVLELLGLDRVLFVPAASPPHKPAAQLAPAADRFAMVRLAIAGHARFAASDVELRRAGPSYTVDTLQELAAGGDTLFLVIGSETFLDLLSWREPRRVASLARLVVVPRSGSAFDPESAAAQKVLRAIGVEGGFVHAGAALPPRGVVIVHATSLPLSASELRRRVREGRSLAFRMPPAVIEYVRAHGLYRAEPA